jgi:hypothetical protein
MDKDLDEVVRNFIADDLDEQMKLVTPAERMCGQRHEAHCPVLIVPRGTAEGGRRLFPAFTKGDRYGTWNSALADRRADSDHHPARPFRSLISSARAASWLTRRAASTRNRSRRAAVAMDQRRRSRGRARAGLPRSLPALCPRPRPRCRIVRRLIADDLDERMKLVTPVEAARQL